MGERRTAKRYKSVEGRPRRCEDPEIPPTIRAELRRRRDAAHAAHEEVRGDPTRSAVARCRSLGHLRDAEHALGERGRAWWLPATREATEARLAATVRSLLEQRGEDKTICPSEAARAVGGDDWRALMAITREVARTLERESWLEFTRGGAVVSPTTSGAVRLRRVPGPLPSERTRASR